MRTTLLGTLGAVAVSALLHAAAPATTIVDAAMAHDADAVRALLKQGGDVNTPQGDGMTALHWAAMHGDAALTTTLLYAGGNVRATTRLGGYTPPPPARQTRNKAPLQAPTPPGARGKPRATA